MTHFLYAAALHLSATGDFPHERTLENVNTFKRNYCVSLHVYHPDCLTIRARACVFN